MDPTDFHILGFWLTPNSWHAHQHHLEEKLRWLLARINGCDLAAPNKLHAWNWTAPSLIGFSAPLADLGTLPELFNREAACNAKRWFGLHPTVSTPALFTPEDHSSLRLISLVDTASA